MGRWHFFLVSFVIVFMQSCTFKYSPYDTSVPAESRNQISKQIQRLGSTSSTEFTFALISDTHFYVTGLDHTIGEINSKHPTFTMVTGDFTNQGLKFEYDTFLKQMQDLNNPFFVAIGNHDSIAYGQDLYHEMFGHENFSFQYAGVKFIFFNNNSWEWDDQLDLNWLEQEVNSFSGDIILSTHIGIDDSERFTATELARFDSIVNGKVKAHFFGHKHSYSDSISSGTLHYGMTQTKDGEYDLIHYNGGTIEISRCQHSTCSMYTTF